MKKQYKIQLPKGKKVTFKEVHLNDGVLTIDVELTGKDENLGFSSRKEAEQFIREIDHINYVAWKKFIDKSKDIKEQKYEPKDGDFIYLKWKGVKTFLPYEEGERDAIGIFKETGDDMLYCYVTYYVGDDFKNNPTLMMSSDYIGNKISNGYTSMFDEIRPATEAEKKLLIDKLAEKGKKWNHCTRTIEDIGYIPKEGEFVYVKAGYEHIAIFKKEVGEDMYVYANWNMSFSISKIIIDDSRPLCCIQKLREIRPATEREKKILIDQLAKVNKKWNEETRTIEDARWRAKKDEVFYVVSFNARVDSIRDGHNDWADLCYNTGNYFKTHEAAEKAAEQIREIFKNSKSE